jgi:hypothetical protein
MVKKVQMWLKIKSLNDIADIAEEMQKWCEYLAHSAKQGDVHEVSECLENMQQLFDRARGQ